MKIVATLSLPAVDRPNADRWNAARSRQNTSLGTQIQCAPSSHSGISTIFLRLFSVTPPLIPPNTIPITTRTGPTSLRCGVRNPFSPSPMKVTINPTADSPSPENKTIFSPSELGGGTTCHHSHMVNVKTSKSRIESNVFSLERLYYCYNHNAAST